MKTIIFNILMLLIFIGGCVLWLLGHDKVGLAGAIFSGIYFFGKIIKSCEKS